MSHYRLRPLLALPLLALVLGVAIPGVASGQEPVAVPKLAVIEVQRILTDSAAGKAAIERLRAMRETHQADLDQREERITELRDRLSEGRLSLSEENLADLRQELEDELVDLERTQEDATRELEKERERAFAQIERDVLPIIQEVGAELEMTMIFNKYQSGLVYADESVDITDVVIERFDASQTLAADTSGGS